MLISRLDLVRPRKAAGAERKAAGVTLAVLIGGTWPMNVSAVVNPSDTNWYRLDISATGMVMINRIEITPQR